MLEPLTFAPLIKPRVWGGRRLERYGVTIPDGAMIGEAWTLADLPESIPEGRSVVDSGVRTGRTLRSILRSEPGGVLGDAPPAEDGGFPLLVKLLDARENLSVQVHPTARYAKGHPGALMKSEAWVVLEAEPGAVIYKGLRRGLDRADFAAHAQAGTLLDDLVAVPVKRGDCHHLPSGICHALGAGIVVAEIQTPSDTTFRVYDWGRSGRELHLEQATECIFSATPEPGVESRPGATIDSRNFRTTRLCSTPYFTIERIELRKSAQLPLTPSPSAVVWMVLGGTVELTGQGGPRILTLGRTLLQPAAARGSALHGDAGATLLRIELPNERDRMLAETHA